MQHCSPHMLHFQGFASEWQPLCRKYSVWSGKPIPQNIHCKLLRDLLLNVLHNVESEGCSSPEDVMAPFVVVAESLGEFSELPLGETVDRPLLLPFLPMIFLFRSSLSRLLSGDTLIKELRLLEVAVCIWMLPDGEVLNVRVPFRFELSYSSPGSCLIGMRDMEGVMLVSWSNLSELGCMCVLVGAFELESADWGEFGHSPFILGAESPLWFGWLFLCWSS